MYFASYRAYLCSVTELFNKLDCSVARDRIGCIPRSPQISSLRQPPPNISLLCSVVVSMFMRYCPQNFSYSSHLVARIVIECGHVLWCELCLIDIYLHTKYEDTRSRCPQTLFGFGPLVARILTKDSHALCLSSTLLVCR